ncbi:terpenoid synthase [Mycena crocata]|nr:terpenoid synthase [Mycena crocata]
MSQLPSDFIFPDTIAGWPWLRRINPHFEAVKVESEAWFRTFKAFGPKAQKAFERCDFCRLASLAYPALNNQRLRTGCDLMMLFFTFDEYTDVLPAIDTEVRRYADIVMDALRNPEKPRPEGEPVVGEVARQFGDPECDAARTAALQLKTFEAYIYSVVDQASDGDNDRLRGSEEYMILRRKTISVDPSYTMQELGMDLVDEVYNHPVINELRQISVDIVLLDNDICSYNDKEFASGDDSVLHNIVTIIMHEKGMSLDDAMNWVATRRKDLTSRFINLYTKVPTFGGDIDVHSFRRTLGCAIEVLPHI